MDQKNKKIIICSFCGKPQDKTAKVIASPGAYICENCIKACHEIIKTEEITHKKDKLQNLPTLLNPDC